MFDGFDTYRAQWEKNREGGRKRYLIWHTVPIGNVAFFVAVLISHFVPAVHSLTRSQRSMFVLMIVGLSYGFGFLCSRALWRNGIRELNEAA